MCKTADSGGRTSAALPSVAVCAKQLTVEGEPLLPCLASLCVQNIADSGGRTSAALPSVAVCAKHS